MWIEPQVAIAIAGKKYKTRSLTVIDCLVLHHYGLAENARQMIGQFDDGRKYQPGWYTGQKCPYHFFIRKNGILEQCLPLTYIGPAAKKLNKTGVQIALDGTFKEALPTPNQVISAVTLCARLEDAFNGQLKIRGHTERRGASGDLNKQCPGHRLNLDGFRKEVALKANSVIWARPEWALKEEGIIIDA
jgi:hypothetical protein